LLGIFAPQLKRCLAVERCYCVGMRGRDDVEASFEYEDGIHNRDAHYGSVAQPPH
jgi:hypothetical protein